MGLILMISENQTPSKLSYGAMINQKWNVSNVLRLIYRGRVEHVPWNSLSEPLAVSYRENNTILEPWVGVGGSEHDLVL